MIADAVINQAIGVRVEQRKSTRYSMRVPVNFQCSHQQQIMQAGTGFTRDISNEGVFVFSPAAPPVGIAIALEVHLPALAASGPTLRLQGEGHVVRVEGTAKDAGFAAVANFGLHNAQNAEGE